ncbi:manganese catalase family protein [Parabacteroides sp. AF17-3]|uniref:manganese catalase family protein n=1 Tax=Parabacteroides sp. AF17-3 TaxID=2293113 RepID=UPI000EFE2DCB|nr:manganese catalase family protein [Parabacteroides sp. AF17-3]RKU69479.1 manganese catalase family protein [Parabacteroides sp. AF17-3]
MFYHVKDLQYNARVSAPDPRFARLLLEQFGGSNGELKAAMQYFVQAFSCRNPFPEKYDMLMDIATEELGHLEIVGATIQMLLGPVNGEMKDVVENMEINKMMNGRATKEDFIHQAYTNPHFLVLAPGSPALTDSNGNPWSATYVTANAEPTVDLRSNLAAESRAKIMYEYLIPFTDDPYVKETLDFLMTREVAHYQQFEAALDSIKPNFPPGIFQTNPKYSNLYFDMSKEEETRGPWNEGSSTQLKEEWQYIDKPQEYVTSTDGLTNVTPKGTDRTEEMVKEKDEKLAKERKKMILSKTPAKDMQWSHYQPDGNMKKNSKTNKHSN